MSADVGFTPGKLIEAAQSIQPVADPFSQSISTLGEELEPLCQGVNGPYMEKLSDSLTSWNESLNLLFEDLGRLAEALVLVEDSFNNCETDIIRSLVDAASGITGHQDGYATGSLYAELQSLSGQSDDGDAQ